MTRSEAPEATIAIRAGGWVPPKATLLAALPGRAAPPPRRLHLCTLRTAAHTPSRPQAPQAPPTTTISSTFCTAEGRQLAPRKRQPTTGDQPRVAMLRTLVGFHRNDRSISAESVNRRAGRTLASEQESIEARAGVVSGGARSGERGRAGRSRGPGGGPGAAGDLVSHISAITIRRMTDAGIF